MRVTIPVRQPFELQRSIEFLRGFSPMAGEVGFADGGIVKSWLLGGQPITASLRAAPGGLEARLCSPAPIDAATAAAVAERCALFLGAGDELAPFYALAAADPEFAPLAARLRGLHHARFPTPFEATAWAVINQRIQWARARAMKAALIARFGAPGCDAFPEAATLHAAGERELAAALGDARRARAVVSAAEAFAGVDEAWLRAGPLAEVEAWVRGIWGAGDFTVGLVLFRGLGRALPPPRGLPWSGTFVEAARRTYGPACTRAFLVDKGAEYGEWVGYWSLYLYASSFVGRAVARSAA